MFQGRTLSQLAEELDRQNAAKEDMIANTAALHMDSSGAKLHLENHESVDLLPLADRQIGDRVGIPYKYYNRMRETAPDLLSTNVNHWFQERSENRMIRMLDGSARAFLSDRYQRRDNHELMQFILPTLSEIGGMQVTSCEVTEHKLYLKITTPRVQAEVVKDDVVQAGLVISNSEVGLGAFKVQPMILRLVCTNGMIANSYGMSKYHVGKRIEAENNIQMLFSDETIRADDEAFFLKCKDIVKGALSEDTFQAIVAQMAEAAGNPIEIKPTEAVTRLAKKYQLREGETDGVLTNLLSDGNLSQYGIVNAITHTSKEATNYDRATELEELGGNVLTLSDSEWREIAA